MRRKLYRDLHLWNPPSSWFEGGLQQLGGAGLASMGLCSATGQHAACEPLRALGVKQWGGTAGVAWSRGLWTAASAEIEMTLDLWYLASAEHSLPINTGSCSIAVECPAVLHCQVIARTAATWLRARRPLKNLRLPRPALLLRLPLNKRNHSNRHTHRLNNRQNIGESAVRRSESC